MKQIHAVFLCGGAREKTLEYLINPLNSYEKEKSIKIQCVITPPISEKNKRFIKVLQLAKQYEIPCFSVEKDELLKVLGSITYDILISCGWTSQISEQVINNSKYAVNVHPTLLPQYRGFRSGPYILMNGENKSGVTVHFLTKEIDKGDIIVQKEFPLTLFDTPKSLKRKIDAIEGKALQEALEKLQDERALFIRQDESQASEYNTIRTPKDSLIDWKQPLCNLYNEIRACDVEQYPAYFWVNGEKVCIKLWRPDKPESEQDMI